MSALSELWDEFLEGLVDESFNEESNISNWSFELLAVVFVDILEEGSNVKSEFKVFVLGEIDGGLSGIVVDLWSISGGVLDEKENLFVISYILLDDLEHVNNNSWDLIASFSGFLEVWDQ